MVQFTSAQRGEATIATVDKSQVFQILVPQGRVYHLSSIWFSSPQKGVGILEVDIYPSLSAEYIFNGDDEDMIGANAAPYSISCSVSGPATITCSTRQATATSNAVACMVQYVDSTRG